MTCETPEFYLDSIKIAIDIVRQFITLSTGVFALTLTYLGGKDRPTDRRIRRALAVTAVTHLGSIAAGLWTLLALEGILVRGGSVYDANVAGPMKAQIALFLAALGLTVYLGVALLELKERQQSTTAKATDGGGVR